MSAPSEIRRHVHNDADSNDSGTVSISTANEREGSTFQTSHPLAGCDAGVVLLFFLICFIKLFVVVVVVVVVIKLGINRRRRQGRLSANP